jgi:hypothetical protein
MRQYLAVLLATACWLTATPAQKRDEGPRPDDVKKIAYGHSFTKHVLGEGNSAGQEFQKGRRIAGKAFPDESITTKDQFAKFLQDVVEKTKTKKPSQKFKGKMYFWDGRTGTFLVYDPRNRDRGTAFRPNRGKRYYDDQE